MTLVKGSTTWANLANDMAKLACGEMADDFGVTVAAGDRWLRETKYSVTDAVLNSTTTITSASAGFSTLVHAGLYVSGTGIPKGTTIASVTNATTAVLSTAATATASGVSLSFFSDTIRMPASLDVNTGACSNRTGYFTSLGPSSGSSFAGGAINPTSVCRISTPYTTDPSTSGLHRWVVRVTITGANTVAGNYSTAVMSYQTWDLDSGTTLNSNTGTLNAAGVATLTNGAQITMSDPSGFLQPGNWARVFTSTYMYGIDWWPHLYRATSAPVFSITPPGVAGTDYDVVYMAYGSPTTFFSSGHRGSAGHGLGIKTATGLGAGALYTVSFNMNTKIRWFNSPSAGILSLDVGQSLKDPVAATPTFRGIGVRSTNWLRMFQTSASVLGSSPVQYWLSIKANGITVITNGDPGATGKLGTAWIGNITSYDPTYDVLPISWGMGVFDYTIDTSSTAVPDINTAFNYWGLRRRQDNSESAFRDWQTRWFRGEPYAFGVGYSGENSGDFGGGVGQASCYLTALGAQPSSTFTNYMPDRQIKPAQDNKWWLYGFQWAEGSWTPTTSNTVDENRIVRGYMPDRFFFIPDDNWASGDELTDTSSGQKYLLFKADYVNMGLRIRSNTNTYWGGVAVAEL